MLYYDRIDVSEEIDVNKTRKSRERDIFYCWQILDNGFKFQLDVCNKCHGVLMMSMDFRDIVILKIHGADNRCIISRISKSKAIKLMQNINLTIKMRTL